VIKRWFRGRAVIAVMFSGFFVVERSSRVRAVIFPGRAAVAVGPGGPPQSPEETAPTFTYTIDPPKNPA
jgi:hypothetical protein